MDKNEKPEVWETRMMGEWVLPKTVEFSTEEVQMIREISWKTGCQRSEVIKQAIHYLYDEVVYRRGK